MSRSSKVLEVSQVRARLHVLEDLVLVHRPVLTLTHPAYLDREPVPLAVYEEGVVLTPRGADRRLTRRVGPPGAEDVVLQLLEGGGGRPPLPVVDISLGGVRVAGAIGQLDVEPGHRFRAWLRVLGRPYLCVGVESVGARTHRDGGLAWGLRFGGLSGDAEEWIARLVAACVDLEEARMAA